MLPCALIAAPVLLGLFYVHSYRVNALFEDQKDGLLVLVEKCDTGTVRWLMASRQGRSGGASSS
jgi:hypothetical protein